MTFLRSSHYPATNHRGRPQHRGAVRPHRSGTWQVGNYSFARPAPPAEQPHARTSRPNLGVYFLSNPDSHFAAFVVLPFALSAFRTNTFDVRAGAAVHLARAQNNIARSYKRSILHRCNVPIHRAQRVRAHTERPQGNCARRSPLRVHRRRFGNLGVVQRLLAVYVVRAAEVRAPLSSFCHLFYLLQRPARFVHGQPK